MYFEVLRYRATMRACEVAAAVGRHADDGCGYGSLAVVDSCGCECSLDVEEGIYA